MGMDAQIGPFMELPTLEAVLAEMAKLAVQAGEVISGYLPAGDRAVERSVRDFIASKNQWFMKIGVSLAAS